MVATGDQPGSVLQRDPVSGLDRLPVREHRGANVPAVAAPAHRAVDLVAWLQLTQGPRPAVGHQNGRLPAHAVNTRMATSTIGINSPAERDAGGVGHPVDHAARVHLEERHAPEAGGVERPGDRAPLEQCGRGRARLAAWPAGGPGPPVVPGAPWAPGPSWARPVGAGRRGVGGARTGRGVRVKPQLVPSHGRHSRILVRAWQTSIEHLVDCRPLRGAGSWEPVPSPAAAGTFAKAVTAQGTAANDLAVGDSKRKFPPARRGGGSPYGAIHG